MHNGPIFSNSYLAGVDLSAKQFSGVKLNEAGALDVVSSTSDLLLGTLWNAPTLGEAGQVMILGNSEALKSPALWPPCSDEPPVIPPVEPPVGPPVVPPVEPAPLILPEGPVYANTYVAAVDLSDKQFSAVKIVEDNKVNVVNSTEDRLLGSLWNAPKQGEPAEVQVLGDSPGARDPDVWKAPAVVQPFPPMEPAPGGQLPVGTLPGGEPTPGGQPPVSGVPGEEPAPGEDLPANPARARSLAEAQKHSLRHGHRR